MFHTYRRLILPVYLPSLATSVAQSATAILLPLYMLSLGHSVATASFIVAMRGLGLLLTDIPAGLFANRYGDKPSMLVGYSTMLIALVLLSVSDHQGVILLAAALTGSSISFALLGRMSYVADSVAGEERGRALALMAGLQRAGALLGPVAFGAIAKHFSYAATFAAMAVLLIIAVLCAGLFAKHHEITHRRQVPISAMFGVVGRYRKILLTVGLGGLSLMMVRNARILLFPLFGHGIGMDAVQIGMLFSLSSIVDMLMFYPAGQIMDNMGRKWTAVPGILVLSLSLMLLAFYPSMTGMLIFAVLSGFGNGITTGVLVTIGSDIAPDVERGQFLGIWRLQSDLGYSASPLLVGALSNIASLSVAAMCISCFGLAGAAIFIFLMEETLKSRS